MNTNNEIVQPKRSLTPLSPFNKIGGTPRHDITTELNIDRRALNDLIKAYNDAPTLDALKAIWTKRNDIEQTYLPTDLGCYDEYTAQCRDRLFIELQTEFKQFGILSLDEHVIFNQKPNNNQAHAELATIIANMPPDKVPQLIAIFSSPDSGYNPNTLSQLYNPQDPGYSDFQTFLKTHQLKILKGGHNSTNIQVIPLASPKQSCVLKIIKRLDQPGHVIEKLRSHGLRDVLATQSAKRRISYDDPANGRVTVSALVTEYYAAGDIEQYIEQYISKALAAPLSAPPGKEIAAKVAHQKNTRIRCILDIYTQMAATLININDNHCVFLDMKNSNWLANEDGMIKIADTKGILPTGNHDTFTEKHPDNQWFGFTNTRYINPPEFSTITRTFSADKAHSYMLGKNLYQALAGCDSDFFLTNVNGKIQSIHSLDNKCFTHPIFKTSEGEQVKSLIQSMVVPNPRSRPTVREVALKLSAISAQFELNNAFESIQSPSLFTQSPTLYEHVSYLRNQIQQSANPDDLNQLKDELREATNPNVNTRAQPLMQTLIDADPSKPSGAYKTTIQAISAMSTRVRDNMLQQLFLSTIKQQIAPSKYQHITTDITAALKIQTSYQHAELYQGHRKHTDPVKEHAGRSGDALKTAILSDFKALTKTASNKQQLQTIIADFEQSKQFKALNQAQDATTLSYNLSKGSVKAFKKIINEARKELTDEPAPQEGVKTK